MHVEILKKAIRDIPDFPKPGILFKDITPILADPKLFQMAVDLFATRHSKRSLEKIAAVESRGFLFGAALAYKLGVGFAPIRKKGKLPYKTIAASYALEYGTATLEMHADAIRKGERTLLIDDLLATGGTAKAAAGLVEKLGGVVAEIDFLVELSGLNGRQALQGYTVFAPVMF